MHFFCKTSTNITQNIISEAKKTSTFKRITMTMVQFFLILVVH